MAVDTTALKRGSPGPLSRNQLSDAWREKADNIRRAWKHFDARDRVVTSSPIRGIVELTQNCNFKCPMCAQSWEPQFQKYNPALNMPMEQFVKIADQLFPNAINIDMRGFGETTILPYWPEVVDYLERFPYVEWNLV